ncbi:hypothetical protein AVEN_200864-1 [Araneus ventricosus]|uniref:Uncharacterized protein n=1 Tax=Araneus ventricosus TaxID=182803 RepID=A0A4Y2LYS6_ARAVE|nr:hypothetical protein AVEN_200864-1 [Araneus ventricosus]
MNAVISRSLISNSLQGSGVAIHFLPLYVRSTPKPLHVSNSLKLGWKKVRFLRPAMEKVTMGRRDQSFACPTTLSFPVRCLPSNQRPACLFSRDRPPLAPPSTRAQPLPPREWTRLRAAKRGSKDWC